MKRKISLLLLALLASIGASAQLQLSGSGTESDPFLISSSSNLQSLSNWVKAGNNCLGQYFLLTQDVSTTISIGDDNYSFSGVFDGGNNRISCKGSLFIRIENATIKNLSVTISSARWRESAYYGGIVCVASSSTISNCYTYGDITFDLDGVTLYPSGTREDRYCTKVGGIVGYASNTTIENCGNNANISRTGDYEYVDTYLAGIVADSKTTHVLSCFNTGDIQQVGGCKSGTFMATGIGGTYCMKCYNTGSIRVTIGGGSGAIKSYGMAIARGISIGSNYYCYNRGTVSARDTSSGTNMATASGIGGSNNYTGYSKCYNCYNTGSVSGPFSGQIASQFVSDSPSLLGTNCYEWYNVTPFANMANKLNNDSLVFFEDRTPNINDGYPIFLYQIGNLSDRYTISADAINGEVEGVGEYTIGTLVSLVVLPNEGYTFSHWSDGNTDNPRTIMVLGDATYTAILRSELSRDFIFTSYQNSSTIGLASLASHQVIEYSRNGTTWTNMTTATTITLNNGDSVYMRGVLSDNNTSTDYTQFTITGAIAAYGNINYLWNYANLNAPLKEYCGANLFKDCVGLIYAPELPSTELADYCYIGMFRGCSSLSSAPVLPAMTLTDHGYCSMFRECTSLTSAPSLPAMIIATSCYTSMFQGCTNMTSAPTILPAKTLADYCYQSMFSGTAISTAPELPATTLAPYCYVSMFQDCASLMSAPSLMAESLTDYCYWRMFRGCTSLTSAPTILPATNLTTYCYNQMFMQTAITSAPELPAKTLGDYSYYQMFYQCSLLNYIKCLATNISATGCTQGWVNGVASSGTFVKNSKMTSWTNGNNGIPTGWTIQNYVVNEYVVNFVDWDGAIIKTEQVISGGFATVPTDPIREGYTFIGWDKDFSNVIENMTITAIYKINRYRVDFLDWDNTILKSDSVDWNTSATAPSDPLREGYTFIGWDKDYHNITEDLTVTAQYELGENANFIVIFNTKEGDEILSNDITLKVPAAPEINGFTFLGWRPKATIIDNNVIEIEAIYEASEETSLQEVIINSNNSAQKLIREGNVYILFDNKTYTLQGQEVR